MSSLKFRRPHLWILRQPRLIFARRATCCRCVRFRAGSWARLSERGEPQFSTLIKETENHKSMNCRFSVLLNMLARARIILPLLLTALISVQDATAQKKSQREQDGLVGPVRTVRIERAQLLNEAGKYIEGPRTLSDTMIYDAEGRLLESADYLPGGAPDTKSTYKYDSKGKEIEYAHYIHDGLIYKWLSRYDATGKLSEKIELRANGQIETRRLYKYDIKENRSQITEFGPDSSVKSKRTEIYDSRGNVLSRVERNSNGSVAHKYTYTFDGSGYLTSETDQYKHNGSSHTSRTTYTYDDKRNMIEESHYSNSSLSAKESYHYDKNGNK